MILNKKNIIIFILLILASGGALILLRGDEDTWICQNGEWIKHGNPRAPQPIEPCGTKNQEKIIVSSPQPNQLIETPLVIEGKARGRWYFEATFPIKLLDEEGKELAVGYGQAAEDWMTENFVPFKGELQFISDKEQEGVLVLQKDNPSGLPENDEEFRMPVRIKKTETMKVKVYFNNDRLDPEFSCNKVFPIEREIAKTQAVARAALEELLKGSTDNDKSEGFFSNINPGVKIQSLVIEEGVAKVDFDPQLEYQVGGSCRVAAIRAEITQTLKQFPSVENVIISINGRTEDILQP